MKPLTFLPPAEEDLTEAYLYMLTRSHGLAEALLRCVESAAQQVQHNPQAWHPVGFGVRRKRVARFPYALLYREYPERLVVLAVMHLSRDPDYWKDRV